MLTTRLSADQVDFRSRIDSITGFNEAGAIDFDFELLLKIREGLEDSCERQGGLGPPADVDKNGSDFFGGFGRQVAVFKNLEKKADAGFLLEVVEGGGERKDVGVEHFVSFSSLARAMVCSIGGGENLISDHFVERLFVGHGTPLLT